MDNLHYLIKEKNPEIKLSNRFVEGVIKGKLEASDKKLLNLAVHKVLSDDFDKAERKIVIELKDIVNIGATDYKHLFRDLTAMLDRIHALRFKYIDLKEQIYISFGVAEVKVEQTTISFYFSPSMIEAIKQLDKGYTRYLLENIKPLKSIYSIRLYELLRQYAGIGYRRISIDDLRRILQAENRYPVFAHLLANIIKPAIKEVNEKTDLEITMNIIRFRRTVTEIEFVIIEKNAPRKPQEQSLPGEFAKMDQELKDFELELRRLGWMGMHFDLWLASCGGFEACKMFWDEVLKDNITRQIKSGKLQNPSGVIKALMEREARRYYTLKKEEKEKKRQELEKELNETREKMKKAEEEEKILLEKRKKIAEKLSMWIDTAPDAEIRDNLSDFHKIMYEDLPTQKLRAEIKSDPIRFADDFEKLFVGKKENQE